MNKSIKPIESVKPVDAIESMSLRQAIEGRCSVRSYAPGPVDRATVETLLAMAVRAPTAMHVEPWRFVVVQNLALLKRVSDLSRESMLAVMTELHRTGADAGPLVLPDFDVFHGASTLVLICASGEGRFTQADCWLAAQNLMLGAYGMGLGSCVIGMSVVALNLPHIKQALGIPADLQAVAPIILGTPLDDMTATPRKPAQVLAWHL